MRWAILTIAVCVLVIAGAGFAVLRGTSNVNRQERQVNKQYASLIHDIKTTR